MEEDFQYINDAGETVFLSRNILSHVEKMVEQKRRPLKWREIVQVDSSIPGWVERYEYDIVTSSATWNRAQDVTEDVILASVKVGTDGGKIFEFLSAYGYEYREMERAQKTEVNLDALRAKAVYDKAEEVLDYMCLNGTMDGSKVAATGMYGLYNVPGVTPTEIEGSDTAWEDAIEAASTPEALDAALEVVITDLLEMEAVQENATKENYAADTVVLPQSVKPIMKRTFSRDRGGLTVGRLFLERADSVKRILFWKKPDQFTLGADSTHKRRIVMFHAQDLDAARMIVSRPPTKMQEIRTMSGVKIPVGMVTGGFSTKVVEAITYADLADVSG